MSLLPRFSDKSNGRDRCGCTVAVGSQPTAAQTAQNRFLPHEARSTRRGRRSWTPSRAPDAVFRPPESASMGVGANSASLAALPPDVKKPSHFVKTHPGERRKKARRKDTKGEKRSTNRAATGPRRTAKHLPRFQGGPPEVRIPAVTVSETEGQWMIPWSFSWAMRLPRAPHNPRQPQGPGERPRIIGRVSLLLVVSVARANRARGSPIGASFAAGSSITARTSSSLACCLTWRWPGSLWRWWPCPRRRRCHKSGHRICGCSEAPLESP